MNKLNKTSKKIVIDIEADGPAPGLYSMVSFGCVIITPDGQAGETFYGKTAPLPNADWDLEALSISGHSREEHLLFPEPLVEMNRFLQWLIDEAGYKKSDNYRGDGQILFYSDNNGFDWQFINYYCHLCLGFNPFGHSSRNINDLYKGLVKDVKKNGKRLATTKHTHHPVDDATANAEILIKLKEMGLKIEF